MQDLKQLVNDINQSFLEFKTRNDQRLRELEQGRRDPLINQQVDTLSREVQNLAEIKSRMEHIETQLTGPYSKPGTALRTLKTASRKKSSTNIATRRKRTVSGRSQTTVRGQRSPGRLLGDRSDVATGHH